MWMEAVLNSVITARIVVGIFIGGLLAFVVGAVVAEFFSDRGEAVAGCGAVSMITAIAAYPLLLVVRVMVWVVTGE